MPSAPAPGYYSPHYLEYQDPSMNQIRSNTYCNDSDNFIDKNNVQLNNTNDQHFIDKKRTITNKKKNHRRLSYPNDSTSSSSPDTTKILNATSKYFTHNGQDFSLSSHNDDIHSVSNLLLEPHVVDIVDDINNTVVLDDHSEL